MQVDVIPTRCGYTGETISVLSKDEETFVRALLPDERALEAPVVLVTVCVFSRDMNSCEDDAN
ncbi:hypothetical protein PsorP6_014895 [Peronosclerospora sorghi]|uniref:Uncharacterized protein n=1 Tax=Peronosclerospora sorghi TaxID=230839 RepID=A0ACC0VSI3_9STRA|nr:hypothetical protein PsorP6_014895 [Peronosclerospora sorghi]